MNPFKDLTNPALEKMAADEVNLQMIAALIPAVRMSYARYAAAQSDLALNLAELLNLLKGRTPAVDLTLAEHQFWAEVAANNAWLSASRTTMANVAGQVVTRLGELADVQAKQRVGALKPGEF